jgi:uncharacterized membrane protein YagU involved in acid resistance
MTTTVTHQHTLAQRSIGGIVGGLAGGVVFGMLMGMMGMLPMVAMVVGSESALIGFVYHMFNSAVIGAGYGIVFGSQSHTYSQGALWGFLYGAIWWVLGPLLLMPLLMGMPLFMINQMTLMSLVGHLIYGLITGAVYVWYTHR